MILVAEIGNVHRFQNSKYLSGYAGLILSTYSSGGNNSWLNNQARNKFIRYALREATVHTIRRSGNLKATYEKLSGGKGKSKAKVACMRKFLSYICIMLKENIAFDDL